MNQYDKSVSERCQRCSEKIYYLHQMLELYTKVYLSEIDHGRNEESLVSWEAMTKCSDEILNALNQEATKTEEK